MGGALGVNSLPAAQWPLLPEQPWQAVTRQRAGGHQLLLPEASHCLRGSKIFVRSEVNSQLLQHSLDSNSAQEVKFWKLNTSAFV